MKLAKVEELYMSIKDNLLFFFCFFPIFIIKVNLHIIELSIVLFIFLILIIFNFFFLKFLKNKKKYLKLIYISSIIFFGFDNHLGLFNGIIQSNVNFFIENFYIIYTPAILIIFISITLIFILISILDYNKISKIFLISIITIFIFNIFDNTKKYSQIPFFEKKSDKKYKNTTLVLIWDEMSGLNSLSSKTKEGQQVNKKFEELFTKYNFDYFPNVYSTSKNSVGSITKIINFNNEPKDIEEIISPSKNYFIEYEINKNLFFEKYKSISVVQNMHINYCKDIRVNKCYQYNPIDLDIIDAKIDSFSNLISSWSINGSIIAKLIWRITKQFEIINSTLEPEGEKLFINNILDYTYKELSSQKYDLVFFHLLVPHKPYGFNENCKYEVKLSNLNVFLSHDENFKQHNIERNCVIKFTDHLLSRINDLNNFKIILLSDHGSRITNDKDSSFSSVFAFKNFNKKTSNKILNEDTIQHLFQKVINE